MGVMDALDPRQELAKLIRERRHALGRPQDLRPFGGPSDETTRQWERGNITGNPRAKTLVGLDLALGLQPGTSSRVLSGAADTPETLGEPCTHALASTQWHAVPDSLLSELVDTLTDLALRNHLSEVGDAKTTELISSAHSLAASLSKAAEIANAR